MPDSEFTVTSREVQVEPVSIDTLHGHILSPVAYDSTQQAGGYVPSKSLGSYAFARVDFLLKVVDVQRGEVPDVDGTPVVHIGDNFAKHYYTSSSETIPSDVQEWLYNNDLVVIDNVDGGWANWDGRPEFSENYIDFGGCEVLEFDC